jgi:O-antigen ligase
LTLTGIAALGLLLLVYAPDTYFDRMGTIRNYEEDGSAMGRIMAWKAGVRMFADNPLLGVSAGHFPIAFGTKYRPTDVGNMPWLTAHSMYFLVLGELALPGIVALLMLVFGNLRANTRTQQSLRRVVGSGPAGPAQTLPEPERMLYLLNASLIGFAIAGAFLSAAYYPHIFVLTALMISARRIASAASANSDGASSASVTPAVKWRGTNVQGPTGRHAPRQTGRLRRRQLQHEDKN